MRILVAGASGYIGHHVANTCLEAGHEVVCPMRANSGIGGRDSLQAAREKLPGAELVALDLGSIDAPSGLSRIEGIDAVISCLASRTGSPADSLAVDYGANLRLLDWALAAGVHRFVLLSAICVQKPKLAFQHAKLKFEKALQGSGLDYVIVRPTAFFKSLAGQIERVRRGKPFLVFGDGTLTACKPIAEQDLARYLVECLEDPSRRNRVLPVGGPGPALSPLDQGRLLCDLAQQPFRIRRVPVAMFDVAAGALSVAGRLLPGLREKAEFARIGRYYATESMLVLGEDGTYSDALTPEFGTRTLAEFYAAQLSGDGSEDQRGDHALF
jgi:divinyl chlorophyllide a 8-vinyl-reductase